MNYELDPCCIIKSHKEKDIIVIDEMEIIEVSLIKVKDMELFDTFPREFSKSRILVNNKKEFDNAVKKWNKKIDCYASVYRIANKRDYQSAIIDKLFFDLDGKEAREATKKLEQWLIGEGFEFITLFSGGGYHVYVACEIRNLKNKKNAVRNAQEFIIIEAGIIGKVDRHVIGDIARIARISNTWNIKRKKECVEIFRVEGNKFDLEVFDTDEVLYGFSNFEEDEKIPFKKDAMNAYMKILPPVIKGLLTTMRCGWRDRYYTILAIKEVGLSKEICQNLCKYYWTPQKYHHCVCDEGQIDYIYNRNNLFFPNWSTVKAEGYQLTEKDYEFKFYSR